MDGIIIGIDAAIILCNQWQQSTMFHSKWDDGVTGSIFQSQFHPTLYLYTLEQSTQYNILVMPSIIESYQTSHQIPSFAPNPLRSDPQRQYGAIPS